MKKLHWLLIGLLFLSHEAKPAMNTLDFIAFWIGCSYLYRIAHHWIDTQKTSKNQITTEDVKKLLIILQNDIQDCKKNDREIFRRLEKLAEKIRNQEFAYEYDYRFDMIL